MMVITISQKKNLHKNSQKNCSKGGTNKKRGSRDHARAEIDWKHFCFSRSTSMKSDAQRLETDTMMSEW